MGNLCLSSFSLVRVNGALRDFIFNVLLEVGEKGRNLIASLDHTDFVSRCEDFIYLLFSILFIFPLDLYTDKNGICTLPIVGLFKK